VVREGANVIQRGKAKGGRPQCSTLFDVATWRGGGSIVNMAERRAGGQDPLSFDVAERDGGRGVLYAPWQDGGAVLCCRRRRGSGGGEGQVQVEL